MSLEESIGDKKNIDVLMIDLWGQVFVRFVLHVVGIRTELYKQEENTQRMPNLYYFCRRKRTK